MCISVQVFKFFCFWNNILKKIISRVHFKSDICSPPRTPAFLSGSRIDAAKQVLGQVQVPENSLVPEQFFSLLINLAPIGGGEHQICNQMGQSKSVPYNLLPLIPGFWTSRTLTKPQARGIGQEVLVEITEICFWPVDPRTFGLPWIGKYEKKMFLLFFVWDNNTLWYINLIFTYYFSLGEHPK